MGDDYIRGDSSPTGGRRNRQVDEIGTIEAFCKLLNNFQFFFVMLSASRMFYMSSGILFWTTDYFRDVLNTDKDTVTFSFALLTLTAPIFGALLSTPIVNYLGGYKAPLTLPFILFLGTFGSCFSVFIPTLDDYRLVLAYLWVVIFFGGIMLPIFYGIMLANVEPALKVKS